MANYFSFQISPLLFVFQAKIRSTPSRHEIEVYCRALGTRISMTTTDASMTARVFREKIQTSRQRSMADLVPEIEESPNQIEKAKKFLCNGCGCSHESKGVQSSRNFSEETVLSNLNNCLELTAAELDLVILANIQVFSRDEYIGGKRSSRCNYQYRSIMICKEMFLHLYGISDFQLRRLKEHYNKYGIFPRTKKTIQ